MFLKLFELILFLVGPITALYVASYGDYIKYVNFELVYTLFYAITLIASPKMLVSFLVSFSKVYL